MMGLMANRQSGFTLIEVLITSAVLVVFFAASGLIVQTGMQALGQARLRGEAVRIAQERLELARNLPYEDVGTVGGIPSGPLVADETEIVGGTDFRVQTSVLYIDDEFDGKAPADLLPVDYKRVKVSVSWTGLFQSKAPVILLTDVAPRSLETSPGTGSIIVKVFNASGEPVSGANVHLVANSVSPAIDMEVMTDITGEINIPGAPICDVCYQVTATKTGYTTDRTHGTDEVSHPNKGHLSVLEGQITNASFAIDLPATMQIRTTHGAASNYSSFAGVSMIVRGSKEIGRTDADEPVYKYQQTAVSAMNGVATVSNLEWDSYSILFNPISSVNFAGSWPLIPIAVVPGATVPVSVVVEQMYPYSLLAQIVNENRLPLSQAEVELSDGVTVATKSTGLESRGDWSQAFFNNLDRRSYDLVIRTSEYATMSTSIDVNGWNQEYFILSTPSGEIQP